MSVAPPGPVSPPVVHRGRPATRRGDFLTKTVAGVAGAIEQTLFGEEMTRRAGLLQQLDPRAKIVGLLLLIVTAALVHEMVILGALYGIALALAVLSRLPMSFFVKRVWLGVPFFAGIVILPALLTLPGQVVLPLLQLGPLRLALTDRSLATAGLFVLRVGTSISLAVLLVTTTRWTDLLKGLRVLGLPEAFVVVLGMTYRYIFLLLQTVEHYLLARRSRTIGYVGAGEQRRWVAASMGTLLGKSFKLSEDVHSAMRARGFSGQIRTLHAFQMRDADWFFVASAVLCAALALLIQVRT